MNLASLTLAQLADMGDVAPAFSIPARRLLAFAASASYEEFLQMLDEDLDRCIVRVEEDPKVRKDDGEDRLSSEIINMLRACGYRAEHDATVGGHSDIVVRGQNEYLWVGEAKIHNGYDYLMDGFKQLTTRYLRGRPGADRGGLLIYIRNASCAAVVTEWRTRLKAANLPAFEEYDCKTRAELGFNNSYAHESSGREVKIRHMGINMYWNPKV